MQDDEAARALETRTTCKVFWRLIPACFGLYMISYLDRANIGYAALQMNHDLALTSEAFGFAAGVFFLGYFLFEVPSNIALNRFGPRIWIARILLTWGAVSILTAFVQNAAQLYVLRFLLGVAEAGFFPGIIVYLTYWVRAKEQAATVAFFLAAIPASYLLGAPLSTLIMERMNDVMGFGGWRWMIFLEGVPAVIGGVGAYWLLTDRPKDAKWLTPEERNWLETRIEADHARRGGVRHLGTVKAMLAPGVLYLSAIYFIYQCGNLGIGYWTPQIVKHLSKSLTAFQIGLVSAAPYAVATVAMVLWSKNSDRTGERRWHSALPLLVAGLALAATVLTRDIVLSMVLLTLALTGLYAFKSPFWSLPGLFLTRSSAAVSVAVINSIGNLGGFAGPYALGWVKTRTGDPAKGLLFLAVLTLVAFAMTAAARLNTTAAERRT
ncbi:MFS transporter [Caulobacter sp. UC70_42]|uniref:MFS transporter n=1 Tax=Caulobacter sp. UC70_42 TaxID=3374551 RepID=UPI00375732AB